MKKAFLIVLLLVLILVVADRFFGLSRRLSHYKSKTLPHSVQECLTAPQSMTLYSLDPDRRGDRPPNAKSFHDYTVLGELAISSPDIRVIVTRTIRHAVSSWDGNFMTCFEPRHGVRVVNGTGTYDTLICFECQKLYSYSADKMLRITGLTGSQAPLDEILRATNISLPRQRDEQQQ